MQEILGSKEIRMQNRTHIDFNIDDELKNKFQLVTNINNVPMSQVLRNLVSNYVEDNSKLLSIDNVIDSIRNNSENAKNITVNIYINNPREKKSNASY